MTAVRHAIEKKTQHMQHADFKRTVSIQVHHRDGSFQTLETTLIENCSFPPGIEGRPSEEDAFLESRQFEQTMWAPGHGLSGTLHNKLQNQNIKLETVLRIVYVVHVARCAQHE